MNFEKDDQYRDLKGLYDDCKRCMYYHTTLTMTDGSAFDGIIENVDQDRIIVLIGEDVMEQEDENKAGMEMQRQYHNYGRPRRRRFRRFRRQAFPLASLAALSLLPYPYISPPYPYYPYYPYY